MGLPPDQRRTPEARHRRLGHTIATVLRQSGLGPAPRRMGPTWTQFLRSQVYGFLSPGARSEEDEGLGELVAVLERERLVPLSDGPAASGEPIHAAPCVPNGRFSPLVGACPQASATPVPPRAGTRARDGPAIAA